MPKFIRRPSLWDGKNHVTLQAVALVVLCLLALAAYAGPAPAAEQIANPQGKVAKCFDGDTLKLTDRRTVRLAGIDTPEMDHGKTRPQYYAREAMDQLTQLAQGKEVRLVAVDAKGKDHYGRIVADVVLPTGARFQIPWFATALPLSTRTATSTPIFWSGCASSSMRP
nr:thermonuclease family protein [Desulfovibrio desulfuricans]